MKHMSHSVYLQYSPSQWWELQITNAVFRICSPPPPWVVFKICRVGKPRGKEKEWRNFVIGGGGGKKIEVKTETESLKQEHSLVKRTHQCRQPQNSRFVGAFMVKTPRIHEQYPHTAVSFSAQTDAAFPSRKFSQCSCFAGSFLSPWATQNSTLTRKVTCVLLSRKGYFPKEKFSLDTTTMLQGVGGGGGTHQWSVIFSKNTF